LTSAPVFLFVWFLFFSASDIYPVKVGKFYYTGVPEKLNTTSLVVPADMVAMGELITVKKSVNTNSVNSGGASLFLIIDNSGSMYSQDNDVWGYRFSTSRAIIDSVNKINPACEVGLSIFNSFTGFCQADDPNIFIKMMPLLQTEANLTMQFLDQYGSFIMLLKLNQSYNSKIGQKTGFDILKYYLQTDTMIDPFSQKKYVGLKYKPSDPVMQNTSWSGGTNITTGFQAAKYAYRNTTYPKDKQFIIFFSDGDANKPDGYKDLQTLFIQGAATPTTFSIYLTPRDTVPQSIKQMNANIKANGYSASNQYSNYWSIKSNQDALMTLIKNNIFPVIFSMVISKTPKQALVNTQTCNQWLNNGFLFPTLFPLSGGTTPFTYTLTYAITKDSVTANGTTSTFIKDTVTNTAFSAQVQAGTPIPDSTRLAYWDRFLDFYSNGSVVTSGDDNLTSVEIRFAHKRIDTLYGYADIKVLVTNSASPVKEHEIFSLTDNGTWFSCTVPIAVTSGSPVPDNNIIEHAGVDIIIATFKNPALPLDTISSVLIFNQSTNIKITGYTYFDNSGDGLIDSIFVAIIGNPKTITNNLQEIVDVLPLPVFRNFTQRTGQSVNSGIGLRINEQNAIPRTWITAQDVAEIKNTIVLKNNGAIEPSRIGIVDKMAPVIVSAHVVDSIKVNAADILTVTLSEPEINNIVKANPFTFLRLPSTTYTVSLSLVKQADGEAVFIIKNLTGVVSIIQGDSIRINTLPADNVQDSHLNNQANPANIRRPVTVDIINDGIVLNCAVYYDRDADGHIDLISTGFSYSVSLSPGDIASLKNAMELPSWRGFTIRQVTQTNLRLSIAVDEPGPGNRTFCTAQDVIRIKDTVFLTGTGLFVYPGSVTIIDSIAPVIVRAQFLDSVIIPGDKRNQNSWPPTGTDILTVVLSEPVTPITAPIPFLYKDHIGNSIFQARLKPLSHADSIAVFAVESITGARTINDGDSIWINPAGCVYDILSIGQLNEMNVRRTIAVTRDTVCLYKLFLKATFLDDRATLDIMELSTIGAFEKTLKNPSFMVVGKPGWYKGIMIFTLEPDRPGAVKNEHFEASITLYDALGNIVLDRADMVPRNTGGNNLKRLVYIWDGMNRNNRKSGKGAYLAVVSISYFKDGLPLNTRYRSETRKIFVGIK
jgi:hypothetical protein